MLIRETKTPNTIQKKAIINLWNNEYPEQLAFAKPEGLDAYLAGIADAAHYFLIDVHDHIHGWAVTFERNDERWFAMILDKAIQHQGFGSLLMNKLKETDPLLNGWVIDHDTYIKSDKSKYISPLPFYIKHQFNIHSDIRLETPTLSAVKIQWTYKN
jgi:GNAT superfamily N-acetyltransferase